MKKAIIIALVIVVLVILSEVFHISYYSSSRYTCLHCRTEKVDKTILGIPITQLTKNDDFKTVTDHTHVWCYAGTRFSYGIITQIIADGRQHPIWSVSSKIQSDFKNMVTVEEYNETLAKINGADHELARETAFKLTERVLDAR